jgi:cytochrome c553
MALLGVLCAPAPATEPPPAPAAGCAKCHDSGGKTPRLACRPAADMLPLLRRYREAGGRHRSLGSLSDTELETLAAWFADSGCTPP